MPTIAVGQPYQKGVTQFPEMPEYNYWRGGHRLAIFMAGITPDELAAVKSAPVQLAFTVVGDVLVLQYRFGAGLPWSDATYTWHKVTPVDQARPPKMIGQERALLEIILVEATTGIVKAIRVVSFSPTFTQRLHAAINRQADAPLPADYDAQAQRVFKNFTSKQLRDRALASCTGGDDTDRPAPY